MTVCELTTNATADLGADTLAFPSLPAILSKDELTGPQAPANLEDAGVGPQVLQDLAMKLAYTVPSLTTAWAADQLCLPLQLTEQIYWGLKNDKLVEVTGQQGHFNYTYTATQRGRDHAGRLFEICGYVGPAPVSLESYSAMLQWQFTRWPRVTMDKVQRALSQLVFPEATYQVAALAVSSGRSLFLFGPAGNGKTSMGRALHKALQGELWIPHCLHVGNSIIRVFDSQCHELIESSPGQGPGRLDRRWLRVRRPLIVAGGEMTIDELDLIYSPSMRFYEAPPHVKANGGTFLIDDLGRQRVKPQELLNRWIIPLEHGFDHLVLNTGQKIQIPFQQMLVVATNLTVTDVADPAFLRRMGYRLHLDMPGPQDYAKIFQRYAASVGVEPSSELMSWLLERYRSEERELRASEPRDLIQRARDICLLHDRPFELAADVMELAWLGYFGNGIGHQPG